MPMCYIIQTTAQNVNIRDQGKNVTIKEKGCFMSKKYTNFITKEFTSSATDVPMMARIVRPEEGKGLWLSDEQEFARKNDSGELLVEFYDKRYPNGSPLEGQFIASYHLGTLKEPGLENGLCLDGGVEAWNVGGKELQAIVAWGEKVEKAYGRKLKRESKPLELDGYHP